MQFYQEISRLFKHKDKKIMKKLMIILKIQILTKWPYNNLPIKEKR
jgi:hypothetical protein